ncbi:uncharacterized protein LOC129718493 [Wyeomyia smithii]|uniref:uncharacterized protein LOC129718493 n=1 Tax=Wyeomyia smithii TaxID=174621 RepID=UPI002467CE29|nr:uncharacterized protein LOC129718493 [Wyeomyia smithii]
MCNAFVPCNEGAQFTLKRIVFSVYRVFKVFYFSFVYASQAKYNTEMRRHKKVISKLVKNRLLLPTLSKNAKSRLSTEEMNAIETPISKKQRSPLQSKQLNQISGGHKQTQAAKLFAQIHESKRTSCTNDVFETEEQLNSITSGSGYSSFAGSFIESKDIGSISSIELLNKVEMIENKLDDMAKQQEKCLLLLAQANAKLDSLSTIADGKRTIQEHDQLQALVLTPVKCLADLENYEEQCKNEVFIKNVIRSTEQIHGKNRFNNKGITVCLQIIDHFVDQKFLRRCSWTGISKSFDDNQNLLPKIAFSKYERYINLFYEVVRNADEDFTKDECNRFFKQCLRNSKQRLEDKNQRQPAARK